MVLQDGDQDRVVGEGVVLIESRGLGPETQALTLSTVGMILVRQE